MNASIPRVFLSMLSLSLVAESRGMEISVAPDGANSSIEQAMDRARGRKGAEPVVIKVATGVYALNRPLELTAADSNLRIEGDGGKVVLSGGQRITGWAKGESGAWVVDLPEVKEGKWNFVQLWVNGKRRYRPRLPKQGYYVIADKLEPSAKHAGKGFDRFKFSANEIHAEWQNLSNVEILGFQVWTMARLPIESVDAAAHTVNLAGITRGLSAYSELSKGRRYLVENVKEALSEPGEWYLERKSGRLTYLPMPGEDPGNAEVVAPRLEQLVVVKGEGEKRVENVQFKGIDFAYSQWVTPPEGNAFPQAEVNLGGAVSLSGARNVTFENCTVRNTGIYAIDIGADCKNVTIEDCTLSDLGAGGVKIGLTRLEKDEQKLTSDNKVVRCNIEHGGRLHPAAVGVWIGHSPRNVIDHNDIFDFYYTGVSMGWLWGYNPSGSHHNTISWNHIHQIGQRVLSDMGGIYTLGPSEGSMLHHNRIHDIYAWDYGGWGIYYDEGTTGMVGENNIVYNTKTGGFHQHYGKDNVVRNNIFAFAEKDQLQRTRLEKHRSFTFDHNIVYWKQGPLLGSNWNGGTDTFLMDYNIYWREDRQPIDFFKNTLEQWQAKGQDVHSVVADPQFVDVDHYNFHLKAGSPALKMGFHPIDLSGIGSGRNSGKLAPPAFPINVKQ